MCRMDIQFQDTLWLYSRFHGYKQRYISFILNSWNLALYITASSITQYPRKHSFSGMFPQTHLLLLHFSFVLTFESMQSSHMAYPLHVIKKYIYRYTYRLPCLTLKFELRILFMTKVLYSTSYRNDFQLVFDLYFLLFIS